MWKRERYGGFDRVRIRWRLDGLGVSESRTRTGVLVPIVVETSPSRGPLDRSQRSWITSPERTGSLRWYRHIRVVSSRRTTHVDRPEGVGGPVRIAVPQRDKGRSTEQTDLVGPYSGRKRSKEGVLGPCLCVFLFVYFDSPKNLIVGIFRST